MAHNSAELVEASLRGDLESVRQLVEAGADVNSQDRHGIGPLLSVTPAVTEYLLSLGADPNRQTNERGAPVVCGVAYLNQAECVRLLLEGGADANAAHSVSGETALHSSLSRPAEDTPDRIRVVKALLEHGADPNRATIPGVPTPAFWRDVRTRGETPLHRQPPSRQRRRSDCCSTVGPMRRFGTRTGTLREPGPVGTGGRRR